MTGHLSRVFLLFLMAGSGGLARAQTVSLDSVPPIALSSSTTQTALSLDPVSGNVVVRTALGTYNQCTSSAPVPTITSFFPTSSTVLPGATITLNWSSSNATVCTPQLGAGTIWSSLGQLPPIGSQNLAAPASAGAITFQLTCTDGTNSDIETTQVSVQAGGPTISSFRTPLSANSCGKGQPINTVQVSWASSGATQCFASEDGKALTNWPLLGQLPVSGTDQPVLIDPGRAGSTATLRLRCVNGSGAQTCRTSTIELTPGTCPQQPPPDQVEHSVVVPCTPTENAKALLAGNTRLAINNSGAIALAAGTPIVYLNRSIANGRRTLSLRVAQPLLCADFATPPGGAVNPVSLNYVDVNGDTFGPIYGGISGSGLLTNGSSPSLYRITSGAELACCVMLPAANASCFQGINGGAVADSIHANGFENPASAQSGAAKGSTPANLSVTVNGPTSVAPGNNFIYAITVSNIGGTSVSSVRVRDWYPKASGGFPAPLSAGSWTCAASAGASCGTSAGTGNLSLSAVSLPAGASVTFNVSRQVNAASTLGAQFSVSAAAFAPPSANEIILGNNQGVLSAVVQQSGFSVSDATQTEGNAGSTTLQFLITRSNTASAASVLIGTADGSAISGSDYSAISNQTVNFAAGGSATAAINVTVFGDTVVEGNETFTLNLANPVGGGISDGTGVGTINNDDSASLAINDVTVVEGNSGTTNATSTVSLSGSVQGGLALPVASSNGTAVAGTDYSAIPGGTTLVFSGSPGETRIISVPVFGDTVAEGNETFLAMLGPPSNAAVTIADGNGVGTINNDD